MPIYSLIPKINRVLYISVAILLAAIALVGYPLFQHTNGNFSLPYDQAFFQLSTARSLAFANVWGIGRYQFEAASPSLLYPLLLAAASFVFGAYLFIAPLLNTVLAILLLIAIQKWYRRRGLSPVIQLLMLIAVIFLSPLPTMILFGMENTLSLLLAFLFVSRTFDEWNIRRFSRRTLAYATLLAATRYDGAILMLIISLLLIYRRKWQMGLQLVIWAMAPVIAFGILSLSKGAYFMPNALVIHPARSLFNPDWLLGTFVAVAPAVKLPVLRQKVRLIGLLTAGVIIISVITRNAYVLWKTYQSSLTTYRQYYPIGRFVNRYYFHATVVADELGVISYLTDCIYLDLSGRASHPVLRNMEKDSIPAWRIRLLETPVYAQFAIISNSFQQALPPEWVKVASWEIPGEQTFPKKIFSFYATDIDKVARLKQQLDEYARVLPCDIIVRNFVTPSSKLPKG